MASKSFPAGPGRRRLHNQVSISDCSSSPISSQAASTEFESRDDSPFSKDYQSMPNIPASESRVCTISRSRYPAPNFIAGGKTQQAATAPKTGIAALFGDWANSLNSVEGQKTDAENKASNDTETLQEDELNTPKWDFNEMDFQICRKTPLGNSKNAEDARTERLIMDLEISNNSLLAINANLESQLANAKARADQLEKQLKSAEAMLEKKIFEDEDQESDFSESETEVIMNSDPCFKKVRDVLDGMKRELVDAIEFHSSNHFSNGTGGSLMAETELMRPGSAIKYPRENSQHNNLFGDSEVSRIRQIFQEMTKIANRPLSSDRESFTVPSSPSATPTPEASRLGMHILTRSSSQRSAHRINPIKVEKPPDVSLLLDELHEIIFSKGRKSENKATTFIGRNEPEEPLPSAKLPQGLFRERQNDGGGSIQAFVHAPVPVYRTKSAASQLGISSRKRHF